MHLIAFHTLAVVLKASLLVKACDVVGAGNSLTAVST